MTKEVAQNKVLIAPLNWGLGHATRCIPIIHLLVENNYTPVIASDGIALEFLKNEFPDLQFLTLPSYNIRYSKHGFLLKWRLMISFFTIRKIVRIERKVVADFVNKNSVAGIISDNRFGVYHQKIPSVYITHQLNVLSGITTFITSRIHQKIISKFDACWVPDLLGKMSLSGALIKTSFSNIPISYIGSLSRLMPEKESNKYKILVLLSGPEPQRTLFENNLLKQFEHYQHKVLFVRGVLDSNQKTHPNKNIRIVNYLQSKELQTAINSSKLVLSRSGYSTIMDLAKLKKKAFFVPTPGQTEQLYLAKYLSQKKIAPFCKQEQFQLELLSTLNEYTGFVDNYESALDEMVLKIFNKD